MPFFSIFSRHTQTSDNVAAAQKASNPNVTTADKSTTTPEPSLNTIDAENEKTILVLDNVEDGSVEPVPVQSPITTTSTTSPSPLDELTSHNTVPSLSQVAASLFDRKDQRAYEVARQRLKKPADREKAREQKIKQRYAAAMGMGDAKSRGKPAKTPVDTTTDAPKSGNGRRAGVGHNGDNSVTAVPPHKIRQASATRKAHEVKLEDLLRTAKVRKQKGNVARIVICLSSPN